MSLADAPQLMTLMRRHGTQYAECVKITRTDSVEYLLTAHDESITARNPVTGDEETYVPANSVVFTAIEMSSGLSVTNMDINAAIDADDITSVDLELGLFDDARIELYIVYWTDTRAGMLPLRVGWVGNTNLEDIQVKLELRGIAQKLAQIFTDVLSLECRADFADSKCALVQASYQANYTVGLSDTRSDFDITVGVADNIYQWGLCTFTSGANNGLTMELVHHQDDRLGLFLPMPYDIEVGDTVTLLQGCPKTYDACLNRFSNLINFRGEPFIAGSDQMQRYPNTNV